MLELHHFLSISVLKTLFILKRHLHKLASSNKCSWQVPTSVDVLAEISVMFTPDIQTYGIILCDSVYGIYKCDYTHDVSCNTPVIAVYKNSKSPSLKNTDLK